MAAAFVQTVYNCVKRSPSVPFDPSTLKRLRSASWPVVGLVVVLFFGVQCLRGARLDPAFGAVVVLFLATTMGIIALGAWVTNR